MTIDFKKALDEMHKDESRFYMILSGDKDFTSLGYLAVPDAGQVSLLMHEKFLKACADKALESAVQRGMEIRLIIGDNRGADQVALKYAVQADYDYYLYETDWDSDGKAAIYKRIDRMLIRLTGKKHKGCLLFWDGIDRATKNLLGNALIAEVPCRCYNYRTKKWLAKAELEEVKDEVYRTQARYF